MSDVFDSALLALTLSVAAPIVLAAIGGLVSERAGVFNIALEGLMLTGAFAAVAGSYYSGSALVGVLTGAAVAAALGLVQAVAIVSFGANAIVLGVGINLLAAGATAFLLQQMFGILGTFDDPRIVGLPKVSVPGADQIGWLDTIVSGHSPLVWVGFALILLCALWLERHPWGLRMRGVGEDAKAAEALGVNPVKYRYLALAAGGALCGIGGAELALGQVQLFSDGMVAGRGWIAVVAVMLGGARPLRVLVACVVLALLDAIGIRLQALGLPSQFSDAAPYVITLAVLCVAAGLQRRRLQAVTR